MTTTYDVRCEKDGDRSTLVFVRHFHHEPKKVWAALTDPDQLAQWSPFTADRDLGDARRRHPHDDRQRHADRPAGHGDAGRGADRPRVHVGRRRPRVAARPVDGGTRLTLRHTVEDPDVVAKAAAGWHLCLDVMEHLLDGDPSRPSAARTP